MMRQNFGFAASPNMAAFLIHDFLLGFNIIICRIFSGDEVLGPRCDTGLDEHRRTLLLERKVWLK
jgi:hypothetical protein